MNNSRRIQFTNGNVTMYVYTVTGRIDKYHFDGGYAQATAAQTGSGAGNFTFHYYTADHLGNVREVVSEDGVVEQVTNYYPFGTPYSAEDAATLAPTLQDRKYNGKEFDTMHGLSTYDYGARQYCALFARWDRVDQMCEKYYSVSPYVYCLGNPVRAIDPDGRSTWVINQGDGKYQVIGGNLNDKDRNIYVGSFNKMGEFVRGNSIGITTSMTSFYNSDAQGGGQWSIGSIIDINDRSGDRFLEKIISNNPPMIDDYMMNAQNNKPYDFKVTNGTNSPIKGIDIYRGMPVGVNGEGQTIYTSARDVGNIAAGYVAGVNGMSWEASRIAFDSYQGKMEGKSTRYAERYGWIMGYSNASNNKKMNNLLRSVGSSIKSLWNYFTK